MVVTLLKYIFDKDFFGCFLVFSSVFPTGMLVVGFSYLLDKGARDLVLLVALSYLYRGSVRRHSHLFHQATTTCKRIPCYKYVPRRQLWFVVELFRSVLEFLVQNASVLHGEEDQ